MVGMSGGMDGGREESSAAAPSRDTPDPPKDDRAPVPPAAARPARRADPADGQDVFDPVELKQLSGYAKLAELLKEAHCVLRGMDLDLPDRADFVRRLLVITAASRHDQDDAMRRLERFLQTVDQWRPPSP